jgi:hypothetical protein
MDGGIVYVGVKEDFVVRVGGSIGVVLLIEGHEVVVVGIEDLLDAELWVRRWKEMHTCVLVV